MVIPASSSAFLPLSTELLSVYLDETHVIPLQGKEIAIAPDWGGRSCAHYTRTANGYHSVSCTYSRHLTTTQLAFLRNNDILGPTWTDHRSDLLLALLCGDMLRPSSMDLPSRNVMVNSPRLPGSEVHDLRLPTSGQSPQLSRVSLPSLHELSLPLFRDTRDISYDDYWDSSLVLPPPFFAGVTRSTTQETLPLESLDKHAPNSSESDMDEGAGRKRKRRRQCLSCTGK